MVHRRQIVEAFPACLASRVPGSHDTVKAIILSSDVTLYKPQPWLKPKVHSSLEALSSGEKMTATPTNVELWEAEMMMTVCRRTRASRQIFSLPLHSLGVAAEVTEAPSGWQDEAVLFSVPPEGLSILESHRTSQHSASLSDGWSPKSPEEQMTQGQNADLSLLITRLNVIWSPVSWY